MSAAGRRVDVVVPCYNGARYLARTLDSLLAQTHPGLDVLVVDDGSTDGTRAVVDRYRGRVGYVYKPNGGQASARNLGAGRTGNEYVCFVDADDIVLPDTIRRLAERLDADPALDLCHTAVLAFDDEDIAHPYAESWRPFTAWDSYVEPLSVLCAIHGSAAMVRRGALARYGLFPEARTLQGCEDWHFFLQVATGGGRIQGLPEVGVLYRYHAGMSSFSHHKVAPRESELIKAAAGMFEREGITGARARAVLSLGMRFVATRWLTIGDTGRFEELVRRAERVLGGAPDPLEGPSFAGGEDDWLTLHLRLSKAFLDLGLPLLAAATFHRCRDFLYVLDRAPAPASARLLEQVVAALSAEIERELRTVRTRAQPGSAAAGPEGASFLGWTAHGLGLVAEARGDLAAAGRRFREALELNPNQLDTGVEEALLLARQRHLRRAWRQLRPLLARNRPHALFQMTKAGWTLVERRSGPARPLLRALRLHHGLRDRARRLRAGALWPRAHGDPPQR